MDEIQFNTGQPFILDNGLFNLAYTKHRKPLTFANIGVNIIVPTDIYLEDAIRNIPPLSAVLCKIHSAVDVSAISSNLGYFFAHIGQMYPAINVHTRDETCPRSLCWDDIAIANNIDDAVYIEHRKMVEKLLNFRKHAHKSCVVDTYGGIIIMMRRYTNKKMRHSKISIGIDDSETLGIVPFIKNKGRYLCNKHFSVGNIKFPHTGVVCDHPYIREILSVFNIEQIINDAWAVLKVQLWLLYLILGHDADKVLDMILKYDTLDLYTINAFVV